jgi:LysM repeat protein
LYRISVNYGVSQQEIKDANDDLTDNLKVGQIVRIPVIKGRNSNSTELSRSRTHMYHTVEKGQTTYSIAKKYNITVESIYQYNPGTRSGLVEGAILKIPVETTNESLRIAGNDTDSYTYHTVEPKETLFAIARLNNTSVQAIIEANPALRNGILNIGSILRIPKPVIDTKSLVKVTPDGTQRFI